MNAIIASFRFDPSASKSIVNQSIVIRILND